MQPIGHRRRSWNWRRLARKARGGIVAVLASLPLLIFIGLVYVVMLLEKLFSRTARNSYSAPRFTAGDETGEVSRISNSRHRRSAVRDPGSTRNAGRTAGDITSSAKSEGLRASDNTADQAHQQADRAFTANLALCRRPAAVIVILEEAVHRQEIKWQMIEAAFVRLIDLSAVSDEVRALMRVCRHEWLYEMQIKPRRFIRLMQSNGGSGMRWQHTATRLICFEFDGGTEYNELLPPFDNMLSQTRLFFYFDDDDRLVGWERPREPRRRRL